MKKIATIFFFIIIYINVFSQIDFYEHPDTNQSNDISDLYRPVYGGDFTLQIGTYTNISLSPKIGFPIKKIGAIGAGLDFFYMSFFKQSFMAYGGNVFGELHPLNFLILHAETQLLNIPDYQLINPVRVWDLGHFAGGGIKISLGPKSYMSYLILWRLNYSSVYPFQNPIMRVSFYF